MVIDLLFVGLLLVCTALLVSGKPLHIHVTHTHKVEEQTKPTAAPAQTPDEEQDEVKDVAEFIQDFLGVLNEE
jgi:hypothetical protein